MGAYAATKFAQVGLAECLRAELAGTDIHVTVVYPVSTETEFFDVMSRETGATVDARSWPRQSVEARRRRDRARDRAAGAGGLPAFPSRARSSGSTRFAPGICDRVVKRFGRKPVR